MRAVGYACAPPDDRAPHVPADVRDRLGVLPPGAGAQTQRAAIADACERRGWELSEVFVDAPDGHDGDRAGRARALEQLESGAAEVLVAARLETVCPWPELADFLDRGGREGWELLVLDLSLDTLTPEGRSALRSLGSQALALPRSELPIPPAELMFRVSGTDSPGRFEVGGRMDLQALDDVLSAHGRGLAHFHDILDFGCGPGRFLRQLRAVAPRACLWGVDQDADAIGWVRSELPFVKTALAGPLPPLPLPDGSFDLVIVFSVFTHLDEAYQDAWLAELRRLTRPGGMVVATVHGPSKWQAIRQGPMAREPQLEQMAARLKRRGFLHWKGSSSPGCYHASFHRGSYIREWWPRWFEVVDVVEPQPSHEPGQHLVLSGHDVVLLRARGQARRGGLLEAGGARMRDSAFARQLAEHLRGRRR